MVFQDTTLAKHHQIREDLEQVFPDADVVDIFYDYKSASIFIYDTTMEKLTNEDRASIHEAVSDGNKRKYAIIMHGKVLKGSTITQLAVNETRNGLYIGKKFNNLLTITADLPEDMEDFDDNEN
jgi:hypothetical protein